MFEDSLWYLIVIGGFGLVLVFVGCFIVPIISFLFRWRYPPLSEEEELRLKDANDPKLQALFQLLEKNAVDVSEVDLNRVPQKDVYVGSGGEPQHSSESNRSLSSLSNKPSSKRRSIRDYVCTTLSTAVVNEKPTSSKSSQAQQNVRNQKSSSSKSDGVLNGKDDEDEQDVETGNGGSRLNAANEQEKGDEVVEQSRSSHASLTSHGNHKHSCAICLEEYFQHQTDASKKDSDDEEEKVICATGGCIHCFHCNCMKSLIRSRARKGIYQVVPCPICRLPFLAPNSWNMQLVSSQETTTHLQQQLENPHSNGQGAAVGSASTQAVPVPAAISEETSAMSTENVISVPVVSVSLPLADQEVSPPPVSQSVNVSSPKEDFNADDSFVNTRSPEFAGGTPPKNRKGKRKSSKK